MDPEIVVSAARAVRDFASCQNLQRCTYHALNLTYESRRIGATFHHPVYWHRPAQWDPLVSANSIGLIRDVTPSTVMSGNVTEKLLGSLTGRSTENLNTDGVALAVPQIHLWCQLAPLMEPLHPSLPQNSSWRRPIFQKSARKIYYCPLALQL